MSAFRSRRSPFSIFFVGLIFGIIFTLIIQQQFNKNFKFNNKNILLINSTEDVDNEENHQLHHFFDDHDAAQPQQQQQQQFLRFEHEHEESPLVKIINSKVRVFCWIMTTKANTKSRAIPINATWAPHCNKYVFVTADPESGLPFIDLDIEDGRKYLWGKTKAAFKYIYTNELDKFDWFLKADDDTYVIMENLRFMLLAYSPNDPVYLGCRFKPFIKQGYMSGGSGYVLSREALRRFVEQGLQKQSHCKKENTGPEDVEMGLCLAKCGVIAGDSRDSNGRHRMLPFSPLSHFENEKSFPTWFHKYMYYPYKQGAECCSDHMISFHYMKRSMIYAIHNLIYHIRPFGLINSIDKLNFNNNNNNNGSMNIHEELFEVVKRLAKAESMPLSV